MERGKGSESEGEERVGQIGKVAIVILFSLLLHTSNTLSSVNHAIELGICWLLLLPWRPARLTSGLTLIVFQLVLIVVGVVCICMLVVCVSAWCVCVCLVCVCVYARARACICMCVRLNIVAVVFLGVCLLEEVHVLPSFTHALTFECATEW